MDAKRGRLSSMDLLPEDAWPHVREALDALADRKLPQEKIRETFNAHLLALGYDPVSRSAFNRKSLSLAKIGENIRQAREMAAIFAEKMDDMPDGDVGMLINEMVKVIIYNMTEDIAAKDIEVGAKLLKEVSLTLHRLEQAGNISVKRRREIELRASAKAADVVEKVAKERGLSAETAEAIKNKVLFGIEK
jgi:Protein of unknown function (DUF3486)